ncbi:MAG: DUF4381 domain-containing protein [Pseudomonadales bacterium]|jgi:hypothetical protein|tara:strand:- start:365 stop:901 length:537 start_codon:yes stop_codon:yes gene_type:complete
MQPGAMNNDPLANLRDLHLPEAVADWPPALGWWLLAGIFLIGLIWTARALYRRFKNNAYRRQAQLELKAIAANYNQTQDSRGALIALQLLMKRAAITAFNRTEVAALTGVAWTQFLDATSPKTIFSLGPGELLIDGPYQPSLAPSTTELTALFSLCGNWIKAHSKAKQTSEKPREQTS